MQPTLFDGIDAPTDGVARAWLVASRAIQNQWYGMSRGDAMQKLLSVKRRSHREYERKYVRLVSGTNLYQARAWHPIIGSVNLGLYGTETQAWAAVVVWINAGCNPCDGLPSGVLPKWAKRDGEGYIAVRKGIVMGWFASAAEAHRSVRDSLEIRLVCRPIAVSRQAVGRRHVRERASMFPDGPQASEQAM